MKLFSLTGSKLELTRSMLPCTKGLGTSTLLLYFVLFHCQHNSCNQIKQSGCSEAFRTHNTLTRIVADKYGDVERWSGMRTKKLDDGALRQEQRRVKMQAQRDFYLPGNGNVKFQRKIAAVLFRRKDSKERSIRKSDLASPSTSPIISYNIILWNFSLPYLSDMFGNKQTNKNFLALWIVKRTTTDKN